jgi:AcrR family transcriptional regulator
LPRSGLSPHTLALAAADIADEHGFDQVTLSALARHFNVATASLYAHIANVDELRARVAMIALEEMADEAAAAMAGRAGIDALTAFADAYRNYARAHPGRFAASKHPLDPDAARSSAGPRHAAMSRAILRGYGSAEPDSTHAVRLVGSAIRGFVELESGGGFAHSSPDSEQSWVWVIAALDTLLRSLATAPTTTHRESQ